MNDPALAADPPEQGYVQELNDLFTADAERLYRRAEELDNAGRSGAAGIARRQADIYSAAVREYGTTETRRQ